MGTHHHTIWIAAPPERVYDLYRNLDRIAEWQEGDPRVIDAAGDSWGAGTTYTVRRGRSISRSEVIAAERPIRQVVRIEGAMGLQAEITSRFGPEEKGTRLTIGLDARWRSPLLGWVLERALFNPRIARRELGRLKAIAEREDRD